MSASSANPLSMFDLSGKSALVIGATGTLGSASVRALAALGCRLTLADRNPNGLAALAGEIAPVCDQVATVDNWPDTEANAQAIIDAVVAAHGGLDIMFIALGTNDVGFIEEQPFENWRKVMIANLDTHWLACQAAGRQFVQQPRGASRYKVVVVSSTRGRHGLPSGYTGYCASKSGLDGMVRALACEWGTKGININAIGPTVFRSPLAEWMFSEEEPGKSVRQGMLQRVPVGRLDETSDLLGGLIYLMSPASDYVTGQTLYIDGGYTAD